MTVVSQPEKTRQPSPAPRHGRAIWRPRAHSHGYRQHSVRTPVDKPPKLFYAVTAPVSASVLLRGQLSYMREAGFEVHLISSPGLELQLAATRERVRAHPIPMRREISLFHDFVSLCRLWWLFVCDRPDLVNASTVKAGLLAGLAAVLAGVPQRVHVLRGLRSETLHGLKRLVTRFAEHLSCACANCVVCVSPSLRAKALAYRLAPAHRLVVIGAGSSNGLDAARFQLHCPSRTRDAVRRDLGIPLDAPMVGFVGRLTRDKGIPELLQAHLILKARFPKLVLLLVGAFEDGDPLERLTRMQIETSPGIVTTGFADSVVPFYHAMDVFAMPTHREGFGTACLEAAAAEKPVVATDATGVIDTVVNGVTGIVVPVGDAEALARAIGRLLADPALARCMGEAGRRRVVDTFRPEPIWAGLEGIYRGLLNYRRGGDGQCFPNAERRP